VPGEWIEQVATASRIDIEAPGAAMAEVAGDIWRRDVARERSRAHAFGDPECD
jgi:hypothetical protein